MKEIKSKVMIVFLIWFLYKILSNSNLVTDVDLSSVEIFKNNIFPFLFPFFVISDLLISFNFIEIISPYLNKILTPLFKTSKACNFVFLMSMLSGFPSNAKVAKSLLDNNIITKQEVEHILCFSHFSNPLFILGTLVNFLKNQKVCLLILVIHYLSNFIIGIILRKDNYSLNNNYLKNKETPFIGSVLANSINKAIQTLMLILGTLTTFMLVSAIILKSIHLNNLISTIIRGILEMTQGLKYTSLLDSSLKIKSLLSICFLSFGGLSIHMQVMSILNDKDIHYLPYLKARILHVVISFILLYFTFDLVI